jgi:SAM-dependent methyltransferase
MSLSRRLFIPVLMAGPVAVVAAPSWAAESEQSLDNVDHELNSVGTYGKRSFVSAAFPKKEYTNSIVASRDTNVSPLEVYETLRTRLTRNNQSGTGRALDVGAGAGVSTQVLYEELGYSNIDAVDWSGDAWRINVVENGFCPPSVRFFELDDERFTEEWKKSGQDKYDIIAFNFAVNRDKAMFFCHNLLKDDGLLLAPINSQEDYWLKQTYQLLDSEGKLQWAAVDVGAWAVQFQPDVTQSTCQGIWCPPYNGFQKMRR